MILPDIFDKQASDKVLGQIGSVAEIFIVKAVVNVGDVGECFLFRVAQKWRCTT